MPEILWLTDSEQTVWRKLLTVERRLQDRLDQELRAAHGVSLGDYAVLVRLSEAPERALRMSDLADDLSLSRSGMTRRVDGLVRQGLVVRRACAADGRGSFAQLTEAGVRLMAEAAPTHVAGVRRYLVDAIGPGGLGGLADGLALIENSLDEQPAGR